MPRTDPTGRRAALASLLAAACASAAPGPTGPAGAASGAFTPSAAESRVADRLGARTSVFGALWTFDATPGVIWEDRHGFAPGPDWLARVRGATARIGEYCSGAVISPEGLILTTQSCARECIAATTPEGRDDVMAGVNARSAGEERICPGLHVDLLEDIDDVTLTVETAVLRAPPESRERARAAAIARVEQECGARRGRVCQVTALWNGARLHRYTYRRLTPVRLVFATELQAASAGGGADHLAWPRHALDFAVLRALESDGRSAAKTPAHFALRTAPPAADEVVFVTGSPISSQRLATTAQLSYERDVRLPQNVQILEGLAAILDAAGEDAASRQAVRDDVYNVRGSLDQVRLQLAALHDSVVVGARIGWEREVRRMVAASVELQARYGDLWDRVARIQLQKARLGPRLNAANAQIIGAPHLLYGIELGRWVRAAALPEAERPRELRGAAGERTKRFLTDASYVDDATARGVLRVYLDLLTRWLPADDALRSGLLGSGETPEAAARRLTARSRLLDPAWRARIIAGGPDALAAADDPLLRHALRMDATYRQLQAEWAALADAEDVERRRLGEAALIAFGETFPSDATFSPRIADGVVRGYRDGFDLRPAFTTFFGLYERDRAFADRPTWTLPRSLESRRPHVDLATPLDFVIAADAYGTGSAVVDRAGQLAGILIGTNAAQVAGRHAWLEGDGRAVALHAAAIVESLQSIYRADRIARDLTIEKGRE